MNKQSNTYTIIYTCVLVVVMGTALAFSAMSLKGKQQENIDADKMRQILASVHITASDGNVKSTFDKYIVKQFEINTAGEIIGNDAFSIDVAKESKEKDYSKRRLPIYMCNLSKNETKYILPVYGAGLWGPIWGYVSINSDGSTIYGAYFAHQGETPGLGAEIEKTEFSDQFKGKSLIKDNQFRAVSVIKKGQKPLNDEDFVDGISGGTITSKGVSDMLNDCLTPYKSFLEKLKHK